MKQFFNRTVSGIVVILLLTSVLTAFYIQTVKASPQTIHIRANGSIDPPTAPISSPDNVTYTYTGNITDEIVVERDNIVVDGAGYTLQGTGAIHSIGIYLLERSNVTIKNTEIKSFYIGIYLSISSNYNTISGNNITNNEFGIYLTSSSYYNTISGNNITNNGGFGINIYGSSNYNTISGNNITNTNYMGLYLYGSSNYNTISGNNITNNGNYGIELHNSSNYNTISGNNITNNGGFGINLYRSSNNTVSGNNISNNDYRGVFLGGSSNNTFFGNNITNNGYYGIDLHDSSNYNTISGNNITNNNYLGIYLFSYSNNTISGNNITNQGIGIYLRHTHASFIYHNNFINNTQQVYIEVAGYANFWDDGYPSGGNYWSDHVCIDNPSNGSQPYVIDADNIDHYPFQDPNGWLLPDTTPPPMVVLSPQNATYTTSSVPLNFTIIEPASWMGYSLDGQLNITVNGNITLSGLSDGSHSLLVYANDTAGNMGSSDTVYFTVDTIPPTAEAGTDQTVDEDTIVTLDGSNSTDIAGIVNYVWNFTDVTPQTLTGVTPTYTFETPGVYTITLNVTDVGGNWDTDEVEITVLDVTDPVADAGPDQTVDEDTLVTFDGSNSTDNVGIRNYTWTFTDVTPQNLTGVDPTYNFTNPGTYVVTLNVTDAAGNFAMDNVTMTVNDITPPVAVAGSDQTVKVNEEVSFDAGGSSDNVGIVSYEWGFGDGNMGTGVTATHTYTEAGTYTVTLNVTDAAGNSETDTITITVEKAPGFPLMVVGIGVAVIIIISAAYFLVIRKPSLF